MKTCFVPKDFGGERLALIETANQIIAEYQQGGYWLTLRQLYYQFVSRDIIPNNERSYKNLGNCISDARLAGLIDWDAIEDRVRVPRVCSEWDDVSDLVNSAVYSYRLPRWQGQKHYVELWVEKDALAGVLQPLAQEYHITLMVNRGYSSQSAMHEAAMRLRRKAESHESLTIIYLGDHDPSGEDMVRDIAERLDMFGAVVTVEKLALTMAQVQKYHPPPNPAKMTDSRAGDYVRQHGNQSWEVDALPPDVLSKLIRKAIESRLDRSLMDDICRREKRDKTALIEAARHIKDHTQGQ